MSYRGSQMSFLLLYFLQLDINLTILGTYKLFTCFLKTAITFKYTIQKSSSLIFPYVLAIKMQA